jgi:peptidoglycan/xylan/chitin deacetylase (PgdA/CDA1 family)
VDPGIQYNAFAFSSIVGEVIGQTMKTSRTETSRREFVKRAATIGAAFIATRLDAATAQAPRRDKALIAITLDCEMSRNFPNRADLHWDFEKGNLNQESKDYCVEAARRVKARGGVIHFFLVARALEQENIDWLTALINEGHPIGNHTYDHVNVHAKTLADVQPRFRRAPWLLQGKTVPEAIRENIDLATQAMRARLGIAPAGFRTPGGFPRGLRDREDLQRMLQECGFNYVSSLVPPHPNTRNGQRPDEKVFQGLVEAQPAAQPFVYPTGLVEIPMSPISDIGAFRTGQWPLADFMAATRRSVEWAIEHRAVFDFLCHPSCMYVVDSKFQTIDLICELVEKAQGKAAIVSLEHIAADTQKREKLV